MKTLRNSVNLIGNLGKDVELKTTASGQSLAKVTIATNDYYKNNKGEVVQDTQWHNLTAWGKTAELMNEMLKKGSEIAIQGKLMYNTYQDKEGNTRYACDIKVNEFIKLTKEEKEPLPF